MRMLKNILAEIDLDALDEFEFKHNGKNVHIRMLGTVNILNSIGDWKDFVALNINTMMTIMQKDNLLHMEMGMCFPCKGIGYSISVEIYAEMVEIAPNTYIQINSATENKTVSRRGRKAKSNV
jgi:hypothetical protein